METEAKHGHCLDWGRTNWELLYNGYRISVLHNDKVLKMDWNIHILNTTDLTPKNGEDGKFHIMCIFSQLNI